MAYLQIPVLDKDFDLKGDYEVLLTLFNVTVFSIWKAYRCVGVMLFGYGIEWRW